MARQIAIRDDLYNALNQLKGSRSFSEVIQELLEKSGHKKDPVIELLESQNRLLSELLNEVRLLNRRLSGLKIEVKEARVREVKAVTGVTSEKKLPSYLQNNPWVEILSERG